MVWSRGRANWYLNEHGHNTSTYPACALNFRRSLITTDLDEFTVYGRNAWWGVYRAWHFVSYWPWVYSLALLCFIGDDSKEFRPSDTRLSKRDACRSHQMCDRTCHNTRLNSDYGSAVSIVGHMPDCESNPVRPELHILFQVSQLFGIGSDSQYLHQVSRLAHRPPRLFKQTFQSGERQTSRSPRAHRREHSLDRRLHQDVAPRHPRCEDSARRADPLVEYAGLQ